MSKNLTPTNGNSMMAPTNRPHWPPTPSFLACVGLIATGAYFALVERNPYGLAVLWSGLVPICRFRKDW